MDFKEKNINITEKIFRAYDIRGTYNHNLFDYDAFLIGRAFAKVLYDYGINTISIGRDGRISSPQLVDNLIKGVIESGINVIDIGICPSPLLYFSVYALNLKAGIMVTGSHNPKDDNGFKFMIKDYVFYGEDIKNLYNIIAKEDFIKPEKTGTLLNSTLHAEYIDLLLSEIKNCNNLNDITIAWDPGNGATGEIVSALIKRLPGNHYIINAEIDGNFPNHHPDPTVEKNLQQLKQIVREKNCDLGIAFDGDGDRIGIIDKNQTMIFGDMLLTIFASDILKNNKNAKIIADIKASNILFDYIKKNNGIPIMCRTGHSFIKAKMREEKALLAGEMSGHIFFADKYYGFDDAMYAAIRLIKIIDEIKDIDNIIKYLPKTFSTPEIRIDCDDLNKFLIIGNIIQELKLKNIYYNDIDGIRVDNINGWWLIRASNTQEAITIRCEANSKNNLEEVKTELNYYLNKYAKKTI